MRLFVQDAERGQGGKITWLEPFQCLVAADSRALGTLWGWAAAVKAPALSLQWRAIGVPMPVSRQQAGLHCRDGVLKGSSDMLSMERRRARHLGSWAG